MQAPTLALAREVSPGYLRNNAPRLISYGIYAVFNALLFAYAAHRYAGRGPLVQIARGCGACMNFNAAFCLLPMMRLFISGLRRTYLARYLALEESIGFHRLAGQVMFATAAVHTAAYLTLYALNRERSLATSLMGTPASITGWILAINFFLLWIFALERVRRRWPFEIFYITHFLGVPLVALLLIHSPNYWKWFVVGGLGYLVDRAVRFYRMRLPSHLAAVRTLPSDVTELAIARPAAFDYRPGDFVFVLIPVISRFEWHPFTISSPPERPESFTLHVRKLGDWTERLYRVFKHWPEIQRGDLSAATDLNPHLIRKLESQLGHIQVYIDGPHGAPVNDIFTSRVAVLIAAGIGVTPFASILQSIMHRHRSGQTATLEIQKVYFIWINRDQHAFEWFNDLLTDLKQQDPGGFFDIRLFVTEPPPGALPPLTRHGRPDWDAEFDRITGAQNAGDIGVFFCGPPALSTLLHRQCRTRGLEFKEEHF